MTLTPYQFGRWGEYAASFLYIVKFHKILARRFKTKCGEIDIICKKHNIIIFVEVKSRKKDYDEILCSTKQQKRIVRTAEYFISHNPWYLNYDLRFDLVLIKPYSFPLLIKNFIVI